MSAPAKEKKNSAPDAKSTAQALALIWHSQRLEQTRKFASIILFVSASSIWVLSLLQMAAVNEALPWYLTIGVAASVWLRFMKSEKPLMGLPGLPEFAAEPVQLKESLAVCFLCIALTLYLWVGYSLLHYSKTSNRALQIVDIQLLSEHDFQDKQSVLPGSEPKDALRKRVADMISQEGKLSAEKQPAPVRPSEELQNNGKEKQALKSESKIDNSKREVKKAESKALQKAESPAETEAQQLNLPAPTILPMPSSWQTKVIDKDFKPPARKQALSAQARQNQPFISEVEAPELVELIENDGQTDATHVYQDGGHSRGGRGAENGLSAYLKELHRKIKNAWTPPTGTPRKVLVLFRLRKDGSLAFLKISKSSGEKETDESAQKAIILATKIASPLPKDYSPLSLDVIYTFKYNVNELEEVNGTVE